MSFAVDAWNQDAFHQWQHKVETNHIPHATLIHGVRGLGKSRLLKAMLAALFCKNRNSKGGCGECQDCLWIQEGTHPDVMIVAPESESKAIKIDAIREATEWMQLSPLRAPYKILVLQQAENLNTAASNALLKTLEEPPSTGKVFLLSERPASLLATVRSRCQHIPLHLPDEKFLHEWLKKKTGQEEALPLFPGVGPYALLEEYTPEKTTQRELCFHIFSDLQKQKIDFMQATEKLKEQLPLDLLRYAYYFVQMEIQEALAENDQVTLKHLLSVEDEWLKLKSHLLTGANLNWPLQCELFLHRLGNVHATH